MFHGPAQGQGRLQIFHLDTERTINVLKLPGITYKLRSIANRYGYGETRRRLLEDENVEIVILHHRAPVGVRMIRVESLPYLRWRYTSMIRHNTNATQRAKTSPAAR